MWSAACAGSLPAEPDPPDRTLAPVVSVTDGDTIRVRYGGAEERVRLIGIDTPEIGRYGGQEECFGPEADRFARHHLDGKHVGLAFDRERRDRYGRLLAYVYVDGDLFNLVLVERGYATALRVTPNTRFDEVFAAAEQRARRDGRGLWSACRA